MLIALLEDDLDQSQLIELWLADAGHRVTHYRTGRDIIKGLVNSSFDLIVLDWMVPDMDGLEVLDWVRENVDWHIPVLFITQKDTEEDVVFALEKGADDYMSKPVKQFEMLARMRALTRRLSGGGTDENKIIEYPPYRIDKNKRRVELNGQAIELTQKEYELAVFLFRNMGRVMSRGYILETVWGRTAELNTRTVDTHISRLRKKLKLISADAGCRLISIYQHGYRLECTHGNK